MALWLEVDPRSGAQIYLQIVEGVRHALEVGALQPGERLSTVRGLAREVTVAPNTVVKAYNELQRMGLIESKPGLGTVVVGNLGEAVREQRIEDRYKRLGTLVRAVVGLWIRRTSSRSALARSSNASTGEQRAGREHDIRANELRSVTRRSWRLPAGCASSSSDMAKVQCTD